MATTVKATGTLDGTSCYCQVVVTQTARSAATVTYSCKITAGFNGSGYTSAGYESYTGSVAFSGSGITTKTQSFTAKALNVSWNGQGEHYSSTVSVVVTVPAAGSTATITLKFSTSVGGTISNTGTITVPKATYTISYNLNGGTGTFPVQTKTYGTTLTLPSAKPTRTSTTSTAYVVNFSGNGGTASKNSASSTKTTKFTFSKWNTKSDDSGTSYNPGGSYTANDNAILYAIWTSSSTYGSITTATATKPSDTSTVRVDFDANGGSCSASYATASATVSYSCTGWWTATSGGTKRCASGGFYTPGKNETLYAQWDSSVGTYSSVLLPTSTKENTTVTRTVTFDANGGTCSTKSLNSTQTTTYSCSGWYTDGGVKRGDAGGSYIPTYSETLEAQYTATTGSWSAITLPVPTRSGYIFKGWATSSTATSGYTGNYTPASSLTLYAIWEEEQASIYGKFNSVWLKGKVWIKVNGTWVKAKKIYVKTGGSWVLSK